MKVKLIVVWIFALIDRIMSKTKSTKGAITATLEFEKSAPKSHAFGVKTDDGILIKVWVPPIIIDELGADVMLCERYLDAIDGYRRASDEVGAVNLLIRHAGVPIARRDDAREEIQNAATQLHIALKDLVNYE